MMKEARSSNSPIKELLGSEEHSETVLELLGKNQNRRSQGGCSERLMWGPAFTFCLLLCVPSLIFRRSCSYSPWGVHQ